MGSEDQERRRDVRRGFREETQRRGSGKGLSGENSGEEIREGTQGRLLRGEDLGEVTWERIQGRGLR